MASTKPQHVAIIGGGPSGLILALALSKVGIASTIFEFRGPDLKPSGGVVLSPNAIRVLEAFGVYGRILAKGYQFESTDIVNGQGEVLDRQYYGHERQYGYKALRVGRHILLEELRVLLITCNTTIRYNSRFTKVLSDSPTGVSFEINRQTEKADMLVGADGVHSAVRNSFCDVQLQYGGIAGITSVVPRREIRFSREDHPAAAIIRGQKGMFLVVPEDPEAIMTTAATQRPHAELDRAGWDALAEDKSRLKNMLQADYNTWGDTNKSIIDSMCKHEETMQLWPYYKVPKLASWSSPSRRVVVVGDAAHAIPPSSGQGVCQAIEDGYSLAYLLNSLSDKVSFASAIDFWQHWRQDRVQRIEDIVSVVNIKRMSEAERKKHTDVPGEDLEKVQTGAGQYAWLFNTAIDKELHDWVVSQQKEQ